MSRRSVRAAAVAAAAVLLATLATAKSSGNTVSITDPSVCLTNAECPLTKYCTADGPSTKRCKPRLSNGAQCADTNECKQNSFCFIDVTPRCRPQSKLNEACSPVQRGACRRGLTCDRMSERCVAENPGRAGDACVGDSDCAQDAGFYCKGQRVCARKKPDGADCDNASDNFECVGRCIRGSFGLTDRKKLTGGVCAPTQGLGGQCTDDLHCKNSFAGRVDRDRVFCNRPRGSQPGRCALGAKVLRRLGAPCRPNFDMCDARRGLSCRWAPHLRRAVCQQRYDSLDEKIGTPYCTPGSRLSACPGPNQFYPTECRATRVIPGNPLAEFREGYATCLRRKRVVQRGSSCELESDFCARGTTCAVVPGMRLRDLGFRPRFGAQPAVFCVRVLRSGERCGTASKFRAQCGDGLRCTDGKCAPAPTNAPDEPATHANVDASCDGLPCAPGFFCNGDKLCKRPTKTAGLNALCDDGGVLAPRCKPWLVCRTNWGARGPKRCVTARGVGAYCEADSWCKAGLECPGRDGQGASRGVRRCSQKLVTKLWRGQRCDPTADTSDTRCATAAVRGRFGSSTFQLKCLRPRGGAPKCQIGSEAYDLCGASNVQCETPGFECRGNVCLPRKA